MNSKNKYLCVSKKKRAKDALCINDHKSNVAFFMENDPIELWNKIHTRGSKLSLVRTDYAKLKAIVEKLEPSLVKKVELERKSYKLKQKIAQEMKLGILGTLDSTFNKI